MSESGDIKIPDRRSGTRTVRRRARTLCTLRVTPAMAAGVTDRLWEVSDLLALLEADERGLERTARVFRMITMKQMASSDRKQKPLIGLRVIEVWCWLWVPAWSIAGAVFASSGEGSIAGAVPDWGDFHHAWSSEATYGMAFSPEILFVLLLKNSSVAIATVNLLFVVFAMVVALGHHQRKSWARKLTLVFAGLATFRRKIDCPEPDR